SNNTRLGWKLPILCAALTSILIIAAAFFNADLSLVSYLFLLLFLSIALIAGAIWVRHRRASILSALLLYWMISAMFLTHYNGVRGRTRWLLLSYHYKREGWGQSSTPGELKHTEWDGWGWAGMNTS